MNFVRIWMEMAGEIGKEVARVAAGEIAERVSDVLTTQLREALHRGLHPEHSNCANCGRSRAPAWPPANDNGTE